MDDNGDQTAAVDSPSRLIAKEKAGSFEITEGTASSKFGTAAKSSDEGSWLKTYLRLLIASAAFFAPLTAVRTYQSAFTLPYLGVNSVSLYANLLIVSAVSFVYSLLPVANLNLLMDITGVLLVLGQIGLAVVCLTMPTATVALKAAFFCEQGLVGLFFTSCLMTQFKFAFQTDGRYSLQKAAYQVALAVTPVPFGLLVAGCATQLLFRLENTFFTKSTETLALIGGLNIGLAVATLVSLSLLRPEATNFELSPGSLKGSLKQGRAWLMILQFSFAWISFFIVIP